MAGRNSRSVGLLLLLLFSLFLSLLSPSSSLRFDLLTGHTKCITEDIKVGAMAVGKYSVVNPSDSDPLPDTHKITVRVTSPYASSIHYGDSVESGNFAFTSSEAGDYLACFWARDHKPALTLTVDFEWRTGVAAKDWTNVVKKGRIDEMELELKKLEDTVTSIHEEMFYLREREVEMQDMNRATNSKMAWFSFLSLVVCLSVAGLQLWHLKTYFERKKLL
ncbi:transmembrane emp24 domain-containing protein p24delta9-like [Iris pallida]|uniref:Transmembrane emp24 domain-containing protein p24delta9-like n=1 Tax=Iris pallida TaxID=29817 RepID=A0AAX6IGD4_IRIPA|nr:transmembrane emp24 domain-containing protein p24delta9-like [Iris pallida]KAJ6852316.1 transmembrane emp24 domain-containing protein p24delta9-like [Iris pallida]